LFPLVFPILLKVLVKRIIQTSTVSDVFEPNTEQTIENNTSFDELIKSANENELNALLMHQSAPVKVYAYRALLVQSMNVNSDFEQALLNDTSCVNLISKKQIIPTTLKEIVENDIRIYK